MNNRIKHIFFDLDHTLWDFDKNSKFAFIQLFKEHQIEVPLQSFLKIYEPLNFQFWKLYREDKITKQELRRLRFSESFKHFNLHFTDMQLDTLANTYISELPKNNYLFPAVKNTLKYLSQKYKLHIITNGFEEVQHLKLQNSKISPFFKTITTSEDAGVKKPNPIIFEKALKKASTVASQSVMIGDTFEADILGAKAVGMVPIFFNYRKETPRPAITTINSIKEIKNLL